MDALTAIWRPSTSVRSREAFCVGVDTGRKRIQRRKSASESVEKMKRSLEGKAERMDRS